MSVSLVVEQALNGLQFGLMLFLMAAGLTLVFGIMDMINLAHGSLYMIGAYLAATVAGVTGSFWIGVACACAATALIGVALEATALRPLYRRDHLSQVLATFAMILVANEGVRLVFGDQSPPLNPPAALSGAVALGPDLRYSAYRLVVIAVGAGVAALMYLLVNHTRVGMWVRAGASDRGMALALGIDVPKLFTVLFGIGAGLCALAGALLGPILAVQVGMGESILILAFVVIVIGGVGSVRGALVGAILVGVVDTCGRAFLPQALKAVFPGAVADNVGPALASISIYALMAAVLFWRPQGLFPAQA